MQTREEKYLATRGVRCPVCGSTDLEGSAVEINEGGAWQELWCNNCQSDWTDFYTLTGMEITSEMEVPK